MSDWFPPRDDTLPHQIRLYQRGRDTAIGCTCMERGPHDSAKRAITVVPTPTPLEDIKRIWAEHVEADQ